MGRYINDLKTKYIENLAAYQKLDRAQEILNSDTFSPILKKLPVHEDEVPDVQEHNTMLSEIAKDLNALNLELSDSAFLYYDMINNYNAKFQNIRDSLLKEHEIQSDLNILCNAYTEFDNVTVLNKKELDIIDTAATNDIIHLPIVDSKNIELTITNITGNGYAGNGHVYDSSAKKFVSESYDSSRQENIINNNVAKYFEYSRLVTSDISNTSICADVNNDSNAVRCTIYLSSSDVINMLQIDSEQKYLRIVDIFTSMDGLSYSVVSDFHNFDFNNTDNKYTINNYILNCGIINIPDSKYVKITFESFDYNATEVIACNGKIITGATNPSVINKTTILNNTQRYYIRINSIQAYHKEYENNYIITSDNIIDNTNGTINSLAVFVNEYVPNLDNIYDIGKYIKYYFIVNDREYEVIPINRNINYTNNAAKKIIRATSSLNNTEYTEYISDSVKNVRLKIIISAVDKYNSPYLSNVKILKGESKDI